MAGRPKVKMYEYDVKGKFVQEYETQTDVFEKYYEGKKRPLVREGKEYGLLPNGHYICEKRIGRNRIEQLQRIENSKYVPHRKEKLGKIACYNLKGQKIAVFRSLHIASVLTGISRNTILSSAAQREDENGKRFTKHIELFFRFEENS